MIQMALLFKITMQVSDGEWQIVSRDGRGGDIWRRDTEISVVFRPPSGKVGLAVRLRGQRVWEVPKC